MAKNRKQDRKQPQSERAPQQERQPSMQTRTEQHIAQVTPTEMTRKGKQKRFGHN